MNSKMILIADDDFVSAVELGIRFEEAGHRVVIVPDATRAMGYLYWSTLPPDLLITDLSMAHQDSIGFFRVVGESFPELPIIVCAESITAECLREIYCTGSRSFFRKPVDPSLLSKAVARMLNPAGSSSRRVSPINREETSPYDLVAPSSLCAMS